MASSRYLRAGTISPDERARNIVASFQEALRKIIPTYRVIGYKPVNATNIRVTYTAPVWNNESQRAMLRRSMPLWHDRTETWTARVFEDQSREIVRFEVDSFSGEFVR